MSTASLGHLPLPPVTAPGQSPQSHPPGSLGLPPVTAPPVKAPRSHPPGSLGLPPVTAPPVTSPRSPTPHRPTSLEHQGLLVCPQSVARPHHVSKPKSKLKLKSNANMVWAPRAEVTIDQPVWSTGCTVGTAAWWYGLGGPPRFPTQKQTQAQIKRKPGGAPRADEVTIDRSAWSNIGQRAWWYGLRGPPRFQIQSQSQSQTQTQTQPGGGTTG